MEQEIAIRHRETLTPTGDEVKTCKLCGRVVGTVGKSGRLIVLGKNRQDIDKGTVYCACREAVYDFSNIE